VVILFLGIDKIVFGITVGSFVFCWEFFWINFCERLMMEKFLFIIKK
jgi:hypothetical protein